MPFITTQIERAVLDLQEGKPVAIPTETVYGLAASIHDTQAIQSVFSMKNRPLDHPLIVHVAQDYDLTRLVTNIPLFAQKLINQFWPGPLTLVFHCQPSQVKSLITGGQTTVAIRCPAHPMAQQLLAQLGSPVVAPSANPFGKVSPTTAQHVSDSFADTELTILDGGRCTVGIESTIVDATEEDQYQILRHGLIDEKMIAEVISAQLVHHEHDLRVPGKLETHYQPQKTLYYFADYEGLEQFCAQQTTEVYVIAHKKPKTIKDSCFHCLGEQPEQVAFDLYYQLRKADCSNVHCIAIELPPDYGLWQGIRERVLKAGIPYHL